MILQSSMPRNCKSVSQVSRRCGASPASMMATLPAVSAGARPCRRHRPANVLPGQENALGAVMPGCTRAAYSPIKACGASQLGWEDETWMEIAASHSRYDHPRPPGHCKTLTCIDKVIVKLIAGGNPHPAAEHVQAGAALSSAGLPMARHCRDSGVLRQPEESPACAPHTARTMIALPR